MRSEFQSTEGILLIRQNGRTMAVHLFSVEAILEAVTHTAHDLNLGYATMYAPTNVTHYEVEMTGKADRLYLWTGADPFDPVPEIAGDAAGIEA